MNLNLKSFFGGGGLFVFRDNISRGRGSGKESQAVSTPSNEPHMGLDPMTMNHDLGWNQDSGTQLRHPGTPNLNFKMSSMKGIANILSIVKFIILCLPRHSDTNNYYNLINVNLYSTCPQKLKFMVRLGGSVD